MTLIYNILRPSDPAKEDLSGNKESTSLYEQLKRSDSALSAGDCGLGRNFSQKDKRSPDLKMAFSIIDLPNGKGSVKVNDPVAMARLAGAFTVGDRKNNINANQKKQAICLALIIANEKTSYELFLKSIEQLEMLYIEDEFKKDAKRVDILSELKKRKSSRTVISPTPDAEKHTAISQKVHAEEESDSSLHDDDSPTQQAGDVPDTINITIVSPTHPADEKSFPNAERVTLLEETQQPSIVNLTSSPLVTRRTIKPSGGLASSPPAFLSSLAKTSTASILSTPVPGSSPVPGLFSTFSTIPATTPSPVTPLVASASSATSAASEAKDSKDSKDANTSDATHTPPAVTPDLSATLLKDLTTPPVSTFSTPPTSVATTSAVPSTFASTASSATSATTPAATDTNTDKPAHSATTSATFSKPKAPVYHQTGHHKKRLAISSEEKTAPATQQKAEQKIDFLLPKKTTAASTRRSVRNISAVDKILDQLPDFISDNLKSTKAAQAKDFADSISSLTIIDLIELNLHLNEVQHGKPDPRLDDIRKERHFIGHGNTHTWQSIRHAVKAELLNKQVRANPKPAQSQKIRVPAAEFHTDLDLYNQHSGRFFTQIGKTKSAKAFLANFEPAEPVAPSRNPKR